MIEVSVAPGLESPGLEVEIILRAAAEAALAHERVEGDISISVVDDETIHEVNRTYRGVDRPTDVLSFPANEGEEIAAPPDGFLGDIMLSLPTALRQAEEYGHSALRELSFLALHGTLHLLGYDHIHEDERKSMFALQEQILKEMGIER